ncbi:MAG: hypothetical protein HQ575_03785 [Candidatus Omnitrophica bacterium]|nr:hypothetical protein [Candidatus Omnitrophota bacterium]
MKKIIGISLSLILVFSFTLIKNVNIRASIVTTFNNCKFAILSWNTKRRGHLDEVWDYTTVKIYPGSELWQIGLKDGELTAFARATPDAITFIGKDMLNMDFRFRKDYDSNGGHNNFISFIEGYHGRKAHKGSNK